MSAALLQLSGLSGGYPPVSVFRNVNLTITGTEAIGLFGPNGHGKTTLLKTVAGLLDPWQGEILFAGQRLNSEGSMRARISRHLNYDLFRRRKIRARDVVRAGLIYVMQGNLLFPEMTVGEVLDIAQRAASGRQGVGEMRDTVHDLFPRLRERWQSKIRFLSGGERQMVSIAVGLLALPRLLILDEPTLGLSPKLRLELAESIARIRDTKVPLLVVDQNVEFLTDLVDRLYLFDHGTVTAEIDKAHMPSHDEILAMMFGSGQ
ncbi:MAG: ATP-binding cassette domain-containing protein [Notoacmeibacter sp.]|nr:ATP-binding cassette domain-containing protein [Notoacmeibacter sp.]